VAAGTSLSLTANVFIRSDTDEWTLRRFIAYNGGEKNGGKKSDK
jgi:hypothetical protein